MPAIAMPSSASSQSPSFGSKYDESKHHRDHGKFSSVDGAKGAMADKSTAQASRQPNNGPDPAAVHAFTKGQLGSVTEPLRGLFAALHAHPQAQSSGSVVSQAVAPELAGQTYAHLRQNAAKPVNGSAAVGQAVDLGGGKLGYASAAGSIVISPPDASGKHQISYTNKTGVVRRAMGGQSAGPGSLNASVDRPSSQQGQPASPAAAPGVVTSTPGPSAPQRMPTGDVANPVPPPVQKPYGERPAKPATPEQLDSVSALYEPQKAQQKASPRPDGPKTPQEIADNTRSQIEQATAQWQSELANGLSPKGNARWRSYVAALKSIHGHQSGLAKQEARKQAAAEKGASKPLGGKSAGSDFSAMESRVNEHDPTILKQIKEVTQRPESYRDLVKQYHDQVFGESGETGSPPKDETPLFPGHSENPNSDLARSAAKRAAQGQSTQIAAGDSAGLTGMGSGMGSAMTDNMYDMLWQKVEAGHTDEGGAPSAMLQAAKAVRGRGGLKSRDDLRKLAKDYGDIRNKGLKGTEYQQAMRDLVEKHTTGVVESEAMKRLGIGPGSNPRESKAQTEARLRREAAAGPLAPDVEKPVQPKPIEGSDDWKRLVKQKASEWDMKPEDFHELAGDLHRELVEHQGQVKEAYLHARKATGLAPADINKLENQGFDSGSQHKNIKQLDTIGRELAAQYPSLGWGRGREGDDDEGDIDYGEKLWHLLRSGYNPPPGKQSAEFMDHVEDFLRQQVKSHGSSRAAGGNVAEDDDLSAVPFAKVRRGLVVRYRKWLPDAQHTLDFQNTSALN